MARNKFQRWPREVFPLAGESIQALYEAGYIGAYSSESDRHALLCEIEDQKGWPLAEDAISFFGLAGIGEGKLAVLFPTVEKLYPGSLPGHKQERGSCVAHSTKNALLHSLCVEIDKGQPDEVTGLREGKLEVPEAGQKTGVLSPAVIYWYRRHGGDGWSCSSAAKVAITEGGCGACKPYPELGFDLTEYNRSLEGKWGSRLPPPEVQAMTKEHLARTSTTIRTFDELRDLIASGYGVSTCGGEGWSSKRDENGFSRRSGSWSHAMAVIGVDDRDCIKQKYGEPLILIINSWGPNWNSGGRTILETDLQIPPGSFWAKWSDCKRRSMYALSSINGWKAKELDYLLI